MTSCVWNNMAFRPAANAATRKSIFGFMSAPAFPFRASPGTVRSVWQSPGMALPSVRRLRCIVFTVPQKKRRYFLLLFPAEWLPFQAVLSDRREFSRRAEGSAMPRDCHAEQTVPGDALNGNAGAGIKPKIDFRDAAIILIDEKNREMYNSK